MRKTMSFCNTLAYIYTWVKVNLASWTEVLEKHLQKRCSLVLESLFFLALKCLLALNEFIHAYAGFASLPQLEGDALCDSRA